MPPQFVSSADLQQTLSDALTSFSPLAALVGANSARTFAHQVTNWKQTVFANLAPIGALGMLATVCKGADLPGIKDMFGAGDADIYDAASELGYSVLFGLVPQMTRRGGMSCIGKQGNRGVSACAILKVAWNTAKGRVDVQALGGVVRDFSGGTLSARLLWRCNSTEDLYAKLADIQSAVLVSQEQQALQSQESGDLGLYQRLERVPGGSGAFELHWPAPAMQMETNQWAIYLWGLPMVSAFAAIATLSASPLLNWQSPGASVLLFGGQALLAAGHVGAHYIVKRLRVKQQITIPVTGVGPVWTLVDNTWFVSSLARRPITTSRLSSSAITLGQFQSMKAQYVPRVHALLVLTAIAAGFVAFYVGGKSSDVRTVVIYVAFFFGANASKGWIVGMANQCYYTQTNNFGYRDVVVRDKEQAQESRSEAGIDHKTENSPSLQESEAKTVARDDIIESFSIHTIPSNANIPPDSPHLIPLPPSEAAASHESLPTSERDARELPSRPRAPSPSEIQGLAPTQHRLYVKAAVRGREAIGMFFFSRSSEWGIAAHVIYDVAHRRVAGGWQGPEHKETLCIIPVQFQEPIKPSTSSNDRAGVPSAAVFAILALVMDETRFEDVFWSATQEITAILMNNFDSLIELPSESPLATEVAILGFAVFLITRMILSSGGQNGSRSLMKAIDLVRIKYPYDDSVWLAPTLRNEAELAAQGFPVLDGGPVGGLASHALLRQAGVGPSSSSPAILQSS